MEIQDYSLLQGALESVLGKGHRKARTNVAFQCPFCNHRKPKLEINLQTSPDGENPWECWVCQKKGRTIRSLLRQMNLSLEEANQILQFVKNGKMLYTSSYTPVKLPEEFVPLSTASKTSYLANRYRNYLYSRGLDDIDFVRYNIGYCVKGKYADRVIIPSYSAEGSLNYFVARSLDPEAFQKYSNPDSSRDIIFFENLINWNEAIILCEGVFDAFSIRRNTIPLLGKQISNALLKKILENKVPEIYICLDKDAIASALKHCEMFLNMGKKVYLVTPEAKDPNELGFEKMTQQLQKAKELTLQDIIKIKLAI